MEKIFTGKVAQVTRGSFGIGGVTAVAFARIDDNVVVAAGHAIAVDGGWAAV